MEKREAWGANAGSGLGRAAAGRVAVRGWGPGQCATSDSEDPTRAAEPTVGRPVDCAASADHRVRTGPLPAALKIFGENDWAVWPQSAPDGGACRESAALIVPRGEEFRGRRSPAMPAGQLRFSKLGAQPDPVVLSNNTIKPNKTKISSVYKGKFLF